MDGIFLEYDVLCVDTVIAEYDVLNVNAVNAKLYVFG